nr:hypothetical protein Hi04_10k_c2441B_00009 [uncultured bacterium]
MDEPRFLVEVRAAKDAVAEAEGDLARLLQEIRGAARAEKITISERLQEAFDKLRGARGHLVTLETMVREPDK